MESIIEHVGPRLKSLHDKLYLLMLRLKHLDINSYKYEGRCILLEISHNIYTRVPYN